MRALEAVLGSTVHGCLVNNSFSNEPTLLEANLQTDTFSEGVFDNKHYFHFVLKFISPTENLFQNITNPCSMECLFVGL